MQAESYMGRKFGPAASTVKLGTHGGCVLRGIWVSAKGTAPNIAVVDAATATGALLIASTVPAALGWMELGGIGTGAGLIVKTASVTCTVVYSPQMA